MAALSGYNGKVMVGTAEAAEISEWNLEVEAEMLDVTKFGESWKAQIPGLKSWKGTFLGRWDMTDTDGQLVLQNAMLGGTSVTLNLYVDGTHYYSGTAYINKISPKAAVSATSDIEFSFEGISPLSYV